MFYTISADFVCSVVFLICVLTFDISMKKSLNAGNLRRNRGHIIRSQTIQYLRNSIDLKRKLSAFQSCKVLHDRLKCEHLIKLCMKIMCWARHFAIEHDLYTIKTNSKFIFKTSKYVKANKQRYFWFKFNKSSPLSQWFRFPQAFFVYTSS